MWWISRALGSRHINRWVSGGWVFTAGLGALVIALAFIARTTTEMAFTSKRVIVKVGFLRKDTIELFYQR